jgi:hypothetical protein
MRVRWNPEQYRFFKEISKALRNGFPFLLLLPIASSSPNDGMVLLRYSEGTATIAAMCYQTLSHTNTYDKTYTQWICLLSAVDVVIKHKTIQFTVTCVTITFVQKIVILKSILDHGRSFSSRASSYLKNTLPIFLKSIGLNSLSLKIPVVQINSD